MRVCLVLMLLRRLHTKRVITFRVVAHDAHLAKHCDRRLELMYDRLGFAPKKVSRRRSPTTQSRLV